MKKDDAEIIGKQYLYKRLIRSGRLKLPHDAAVKFVGADSAYHLYRVNILKKKLKRKSEK